MKNHHIVRCIELIEEMKLLIYREPTSVVRKNIEERLNYLKEVFLIQKDQNDSRNRMINLTRSINKKREKNGLNE